jgi:para-aminobenzoate synthetase component 1
METGPRAPTHQALRYVAPSGALVEEIDWVDPEAAFLPHADKPMSLWLDSSDTAHVAARYSFIALSPYETLAYSAHRAKAGLAALDEKLRAHQSLWADLPPEIDAQLPPFRGGAAGLFAYDLGFGLDAAFDLDVIHQTPSQTPNQTEQDAAMTIGLYASVLAFDHDAQRCFIIATGLPQENAAARADAARQDISRWQDRLTGVPNQKLPPLAADPLAVSPRQLPHSNFSKSAYCQTVAQVVADILNGDIFQANLSQCFRAELAAGDDALSYYRRLRRIGAAPFSAFFRLGDRALASASPERFLLMADGQVETRPIKGTQKRKRDPHQDAAVKAALAASEKDRAENVMIVDLLRNDLAKNCRLNSIHVPQLCALESFANIHHLVSTVQGDVADNVSPLRVLADCFPGGSITGAPKIRAMQLIRDYEKTLRGASYGSLGYIGFDGAMDTNIIIRTAEIRDRQISFHVGGGIVADSVPEAEYIETLNKARSLMSALGVDVDEWARAQEKAQNAVAR